MRKIERYCFWQKWRVAKMKSPKKIQGRFRERQGVRRSIAAVQPASINKQKHSNKESLLQRSYKRRYKSNIAAFSYAATIVSVENDMFIAVGFWSAAMSIYTPLIHTYCSGLLSCHNRTPQKTIPIAAVTKNTTIDPIYNSGPKKCHNMQHITSFFAPTAKKSPQ